MVSWTGIRNLDRTERVLAPNMQAERLTGDISNFALDKLPEYYWTRLSALNSIRRIGSEIAPLQSVHRCRTLCIDAMASLACCPRCHLLGEVFLPINHF